jgi:Zn-dependent peptidase ImmA (M78 family)
MVRRKLVRKLALRLLSEFAVDSAPVPVKDIADDLGVTVQLAPAQDDLSGFLFRDHAAKRSVIGVNSGHSATRQKFTIAHELGHFLLHDYEDVHVDRGFSVKLRSGKSSEGTDDEEKEANLFAAELLMPKHFIESDLNEIDDFDLVDENVIAELARKYSVSTQAMTFRLSYLGLIEL